MSLLDIIAVINLVLLTGLAFLGAPTVYLGVAVWLTLPFTTWPLDLTASYPGGINLVGIMFAAAIVLLALRGSHRIPARNVAAFTTYVAITVIGYGLWRISKSLYGPELAYGDLIVIDGFLGILLVAGLPAAALLLTRRRRPNGTPRNS